ncbi:MAG: helix-turn-helix domain-containing protein [Chloroflexi bacterium]|nr:helix-turn-helix domain-containing protein [Chloroflexota bacterium]
MRERGAPVTAVCQHYGISRKSPDVSGWWRRYEEAQEDWHALRDLSRGPHSHPRAASSRACSSGSGRGTGRVAAPKWAKTWASSRAVLASLPRMRARSPAPDGG